MAHYERLSLDAQQRQIKAVWQSRRLALGEKRRAMLVEDGVGGLIEEGDWRGGGGSDGVPHFMFGAIY